MKQNETHVRMALGATVVVSILSVSFSIKNLTNPSISKFVLALELAAKLNLPMLYLLLLLLDLALFSLPMQLRDACSISPMGLQHSLHVQPRNNELSSGNTFFFCFVRLSGADG